MRTYIKAYMSLNFGQIPPLTTELAALERLKNRCHYVISVDIDPIFFKLAGNKNMHNIMNEFEFRPDRTTHYGVSYPWASKKYPYRPYNGENGVSTFSLLFLIGCFWYFHVTRTSIKSWTSLNLLKWDLTLAHWTQVSDCCPLGYLFVVVVDFSICPIRFLSFRSVSFRFGAFRYRDVNRIPIRNSSANSVNQTSDVSRWISWWRHRKPCQHHNKFKCSEITAILRHTKLYWKEGTLVICCSTN